MLLNSLFRHWSYRLFAPGTMLRERYEALKQLLNYDILCHEQMAELQDMLHGGQPEDLVSIRKRFTLFSEQVAGMVDSLETLSPGSATSLKSYHKKFDFYTRFLLAPPKIEYTPPFVLLLNAIEPTSKVIGNKAKHLAVLNNQISIPVPAGYAVTTGGYHYFIEYNDLRSTLDELLGRVQIHSSGSLSDISSQLQGHILQGEMPPVFEQELFAAYDLLQKHSPENELQVAVRSSAIIEDSGFSFAGQYATILNVQRDQLITAYKKVLASKYTPEALFYRISNGLGDEQTAMSVLIQIMVPAVASGVVYTQDVLNNQEILHIHATRGLGEQLVGGRTTPETYVFTRELAPVQDICEQHILDQEQAQSVAALAMQIEDFFGTPQDIEWAINEQGELNILQARPLHIEKREQSDSADEVREAEFLVSGMERAASGAGCGEVYKLGDTPDLAEVPVGAVLVTKESPPEFVKLLNKVVAVVAEKGSRASHFATVAREFGVPFLTGKQGIAKQLQQGELVTVDGYAGNVYAGKVEHLLERAEQARRATPHSSALHEAMKFVTPLELIDPLADNFSPEGCRSMHDIIRFCHETALHAMFTTARPGTGRGALRLDGDIPLDVFLFDVGSGFTEDPAKHKSMALQKVASAPFHALWKGMSHPDVQWKQKPFDWEAYDKIELAGGVPPKKDSFAFASYAVIGADYLHFNIRFGYHFTIVDVLMGENPAENYCMLRFAGGGGDYDHRLLRIDFIVGILTKLGFKVEQKGDLLEGKLQGLEAKKMADKLDMLGRLLGATKLMDMVLEDDDMVAACIDDFFGGRYSFSQEG